MSKSKSASKPIKQATLPSTPIDSLLSSYVACAPPLTPICAPALTPAPPLASTLPTWAVPLASALTLAPAIAPP